MSIKDIQGSFTKFWRADAYLHDCSHNVYGRATFLLPSLDPRRAPLSYKVVLGASIGLYWIFKHESYPHEHVIPRPLPEPHSSMTRLSTQDGDNQKLEENTDDATTDVSQGERAHTPAVSVIREDVQGNLLEKSYDDSSESSSESVHDTPLTSFSLVRCGNLPIEVKSEELSHHIQAFQLEDENHVDKPSRVVEWLNLALSDRQENLRPDILLSEPESWRDGVSDERGETEDVIGDGLAVVVSQTTEQEAPLPMVKPEREEIDITAAFGGMGPTDLEDDFEDAELMVEARTFDTAKAAATEVDDRVFNMSKFIEESPALYDLIVTLEQDRQAYFVGIQDQKLLQKPQLQHHIPKDVIAQAIQKFSQLPGKRWNAKEWAMVIGSVKYAYLHTAHIRCVNDENYQPPRLGEFEKFGLLCPHVHGIKQPPIQVKDKKVNAHKTYHHENYLKHPVDYRTSTSPQISLWLVHFSCRRNKPFNSHIRQGVLASQATKTVDPFLYTGPQQYLETYVGTKLQNEVVGHVNRVYEPKGTWQKSQYQDEAAPMLPNDVGYFFNADRGCEGMQIPYYMDPKDYEWNYMVVNSDCGYLGPPRGAFIDMWKKTCVCESAEKTKPYVCKFHKDPRTHVGKSPLRNAWSASGSEDDAIMPQMPFTAEKDEGLETEPFVAHSPPTVEQIEDEPAKPVEKPSSMITITENSPAEQLVESARYEILDGLSEETIDIESNEFYGTSVIETENVSLPGSEESEDFDVDAISLPATNSQSQELIGHEDDKINFDEDPDYTESWLKPASGSSDMAAAHLAKFSDDVVNVPPERPENPMAAQLARWSDEEDVLDQDFEGELDFSDGLEFLDGGSRLNGEESLSRAAAIDGNGCVDQAPISSGSDGLRLSPSSMVNRNNQTPEDTAKESAGDVSDPIVDEVAQADFGPSPSPQGGVGSSSSSSGGSSPPDADESTPTTPDVDLPVDLEIEILQERLNELLAKKYARKYPTLEDFGNFSGTEERIPLFPIAAKTSPGTMKLIGILAQATAKDPEIGKFVQSLTDAMVSKDLCVRPELVREPKPEPEPEQKPKSKPEPVDIIDGGSEEALVPDAFSISHPVMLFESEVAQLAEALKITEGEMEAATLAGELQNLEDNAAINGGHIFFEPLNAGVSFQTDKARSLINKGTPTADEELAKIPNQLPTPEPIVEVIPVSSYVSYSDMLELHSAPDFNEHLYGTINLGITRKVRKFARKLKFWGKVQSGKLDLGA